MGRKEKEAVRPTGSTQRAMTTERVIHYMMETTPRNETPLQIANPLPVTTTTTTTRRTKPTATHSNPQQHHQRKAAPDLGLPHVANVAHRLLRDGAVLFRRRKITPIATGRRIGASRMPPCTG